MLQKHCMVSSNTQKQSHKCGWSSELKCNTTPLNRQHHTSAPVTIILWFLLTLSPFTRAYKHVSEQHRRIICALTWASTSDREMPGWTPHHQFKHKHTHTHSGLPWISASRLKELSYITHLSHSQWLNGLSFHLSYLQQKKHCLCFFSTQLTEADAEPPHPQNKPTARLHLPPSMCTGSGSAMLPWNPHTDTKMHNDTVQWAFVLAGVRIQ